MIIFSFEVLSNNIITLTPSRKLYLLVLQWGPCTVNSIGNKANSPFSVVFVLNLWLYG